MSNEVLLQRYLSYKLQLEQQKNLRYSLPHLYAHKFYDFQVEFIKNNKDKIQILAAANQLGKSTSQIIKAIEWGFSDDDFRMNTWKTYNENIGKEVSLYDPYSDKLLFFYLYPDEETALREFKTKWLKYLPKLDLLPENMREKYAWSVNSGYNKNIEFLKEINNLSLRKCDIFFLTYGKNVLTMQASTAHAVFSDEELPETLYPELNVRLRATNGFFHMVYTCTRGELSWYRAMECIGSPEETFVGAWKRIVSLWDCQKYSDGSYSMWSPNRIREEEKKCLSENDRLIRIEGRSIMSSDQLLVKYFENDLVIKSFTLPLDWEIWCGIDIGSGGKNHKSAITITGVPPDRKSCVVLECWREDELPTSEDDVLRMYKKMIKKYNRAPITFYDYAAKDFEKLMLADNSVTMYKAEKSHEIGFGIMNTLMKAKRVKFVESSHVYKLIQEMKTVKEKDAKHKRLDDACFVGSTLVATDKGFVKIKNITVGDMVWTRFGFKKVIGTMNRLEKVNTFSINKHNVICTNNHKFITNNGIKPINELTNRDTVIKTSLKEYITCVIKEKLKELNLKGLFLEDTQTQQTKLTEDILSRQETIGNKELKLCIKKFGKNLMGLFLKDTISIMLMVIQVIMIFLTYNVSLVKSICQNIVKNITKITKTKLLNTWKVLGHLLKNGILQKKVLSGIKIMAKIYSVTYHTTNMFVTIVARLINLKLLIQKKKTKEHRLGFVVTTVNQHTEENKVLITLKEFVKSVVKRLYVINITKLYSALGRVQVGIDNKYHLIYNITVKDVHEYNVMLNHCMNCDSFRYSIARIPFDTMDLHESIEILPKEEQTVKVESKEVDMDRGGRVIDRQEKVYTDYEKEIMDYNDLISL